MSNFLLKYFRRFTFALYSKRSPRSLSISLRRFVDRVGIVGTQNVLGGYLVVFQRLLVRIEGFAQTKNSVHTPCLFQLNQQVRHYIFSALLSRHTKHEASKAYVDSGCIYRKGGFPSSSKALMSTGLVFIKFMRKSYMTTIYKEGHTRRPGERLFGGERSLSKG